MWSRSGQSSLPAPRVLNWQRQPSGGGPSSSGKGSIERPQSWTRGSGSGQHASAGSSTVATSTKIGGKSVPMEMAWNRGSGVSVVAQENSAGGKLQNKVASPRPAGLVQWERSPTRKPKARAAGAKRGRDPVEPQGFRDLSPKSKRAKRQQWRSTNFPPPAKKDDDSDADLTVLERNTPGPAARDRYKKVMAEFDRFSHRRSFKVSTDQEIDRAGAYMLQEMFYEGRSKEEGDVFHASLKNRWAQFQRNGPSKLVRVPRCLAGWKRTQRPTARLPVPSEFMALVAAKMVARGKRRMAAGYWVGLECYLRPGEMVGLSRSQLCPPVPGSLSSRDWVISLHPRAGGQASKTGIFDEAIALDLPIHKPLEGVLRYLRADGGDETLLGCTGLQLHAEVTAAAKGAGLEDFGVVPYSARHAAPSRDRARKLRSQNETQRRGRWELQTSMRRYEQSARLTEQLNRVPAALRAQGVLAEQRIAEVLMGTFDPFA